MAWRTNFVRYRIMDIWHKKSPFILTFVRVDVKIKGNKPIVALILAKGIEKGRG